MKLRTFRMMSDLDLFFPMEASARIDELIY